MNFFLAVTEDERNTALDSGLDLVLPEKHVEEEPCEKTEAEDTESESKTNETEAAKEDRTQAAVDERGDNDAVVE